MKNRNRSLILKEIVSSGKLSKKDLSNKLNLTPASLTIICNEMIKEGILQLAGEMTEKRAGRKKILLKINYNVKFVYSINIESEKVFLIIMNLKGEDIDTEVLSLSDFNNLESLLIEAYDFLELMRRRNKIKPSNILGIGVSIPGSVNEETGVVRNSMPLLSKGGNTKEILESIANYPVTIQNNVKALACGQLLHTNHKKNFIFIKYGPGVGSAMITNGKIYSGKSNLAGEIGHTLINSSNPSLCKYCKNYGCLESYIHFYKIQALANNKNIYNILDLASKGNILEKDIIENISTLFSRSIYNYTVISDPEEIILYGEIFKNDYFKSLIAEDINTLLKSRKSITNNQNTILRFIENIEGHIKGGGYIAIKKFFYDSGGKTV